MYILKGDKNDKTRKHGLRLVWFVLVWSMEESRLEKIIHFHLRLE